MRGESRKILIGIIVVAVALGVWYGAALAKSKARLREAYAALERDGRPMQAADLVLAEVPEAQNAAALYERAVSMLSLPLDDLAEKDLLERLARLSRAMFDEPEEPDKLVRHQQRMAELRQRMEQDVVVAALAVVEEGSRRPACRFDRELTGVLFQDTRYSEPLSNGLRNLGIVLGARACLEAERGDPQKAWNTVQILLRYSDVLYDDPTSVDPWVPFAVTSRACRVIRRLCETARPDDDAYRAIEDLLKNQDDVGPFVRALDGARLLHAEELFNLPKDKLYDVLRAEDGADGTASPEFLFRLGFCQATFGPTFIADHATYLEVMRRSAQLLEGPYVHREAPACKEIRDLSRRYTLTRRLAPRAGIMKDIHCSLVASANMARAGLGLLRFRRAHGQFPQTLDALDVEGLIDPYDGQPLRYRREGAGFVVYSVDEDQQDNGGAVRQPRQKTGFDMVWRFGCPETPAAGDG